MSIEIVGKYPPRPRVITGLYSLDRAFINDENELGFPIGHGNEFFGLNYIGNSTFALSLAGIIAKNQKENISFADLEGFDRNHLTRILTAIGFDGKIYIPDGTVKVAVQEYEEYDLEEFEEDTPKKSKKKEEKEYDEIILAELVRNMRKDNCCVGILDSIGAISPLSEVEGDLGEPHMGRRGFVMAQFSRRGLKLCREPKTSKTILMLNHWYPKLGGRGYTTPGGEVKKYLTSVQVLLKKKESFPDESYVLEGTVKKNRWGYPNKIFHVFMLSGKGIHLGLSAVYDCLIYGKAQRGKSKGIPIKLGEQKFTLAGLVKEAKAGNDEYFTIFRDTLAGIDRTSTDEGNAEDTEDTDSSSDGDD